MKKFALALLVSALLFSCSNVYHNRKLGIAFEQLISDMQQNNTLNLDFSEITDFKWDQLLIITPYMPSNQLENILEDEASRLEHLNMASRDDVNVLVFLHRHKVIQIAEVSRMTCDFENIPVNLIERIDAHFQLEERDDQLVLVHR